MRYRFAYTALVAFLASCGSNEAPSQTESAHPDKPVQALGAKYVVRPGKISFERASNGTDWLVSGQFMYAKTQKGEKGIYSDGVGGACLVIEQGAQCDTDANCQDHAPQGGHGYCLREDASDNGANGGKCWVKGADKSYCTKAPKMTGAPLSEGANSIPYDSEILKAQISATPTRVRMLTCLNPPKATWPVKIGPDGKKTQIPPCATKSKTTLEIVGDPVSSPS